MLTLSFPSLSLTIARNDLTVRMLYCGFDSLNFLICSLFFKFSENKLKYVTVMICVAVKGKPTMGVTYFPFAEQNKPDMGKSFTSISF